jgi:CRISPR/Cas system-associated exonuclease Cas4 (RecB family)
MLLDFKGMFDSYAAKNQKAFSHDRSKSVGASEVFGCIRKAWAKKRGVVRDTGESSWGATSRGDLIENYHIVPVFESELPEGYGYIGAGQDQKTFVDEESQLSATPDGLIDGLSRDALKLYDIEDIESDCIVTEYKSVDPRVNLKEEKAIHRGQVITQMGLIREKTEFKPRYGVIIYVNASFLDDVKVYVVRFEEEVYEQAKKRAKLVFSANNPQDLRPEGKLNGGCQFCEFTSWCAKVTGNSMPPEGSKDKLSDQQKSILKTLAIAYTQTSQSLKEAETTKDELSEKIKETLRAFNVRKASDKTSGDEWSVSYTFVNGRETLDKRAMEEDGIDLSQYTTTGNGYERLAVKTK